MTFIGRKLRHAANAPSYTIDYSGIDECMLTTTDYGIDRPLPTLRTTATDGRA